MKAFIMTRVSSEKQEDGYSLEAQREKLLEYCERRELDVVKISELVESSTRGDRKEFVAMLDQIRRAKEKIALVCTKTDRLQRGYTHLPILKELMLQDKLEIHLAFEGKILNKDSKSSDWLMFNITTAVAEDFTNKISENVKQSNERKIAIGEWCGAAPLGYRNIRTEENKSDIIPDPERDFILRRMFEEFSLGSDTLGSITRKSKEWGLVSKKGRYLDVSTVYQIFDNPFYYGEMRVKGNIYPHKYPPLVSREVWEKCQTTLHHKAKWFKYASRPNVFRGILKCAKCGNAMSPSTAKGHVYLCCSSYARKHQGRYCGNPFVREDAILDQLADEVFSKFRLPEEGRDKLLALVNESLNAETGFMLREVGVLRNQDDDLRRRISTLLDLLTDGSITRDEYAGKKRELEGKRRDIETRLNSFAKADDRFILTMESLIFLASNAAGLFRGLNLEEKHALIKLVVSNLVVEDKKARYCLASPFDLLAGLGENRKWLGWQDSNLRPID
ncbi:MAG: recombinase family protein [Rickettsiales bacterium]|nr:recombinase family protein [Rickettsiales bacterium]